jgi:hypothetical protein
MTVTVLDPIDDVDEKFLENMVTDGKSVTGVDNVIFISPAHDQRGPRIKIAIDPPLRTRADLHLDRGSESSNRPEAGCQAACESA